jgi:putative transposase
VPHPFALFAKGWDGNTALRQKGLTIRMRVPHPFAPFAKGWDKIPPVPKGLQRRHGGGERHFITCSCNHRQPFLGSSTRRDLFLKILEEVRQKYDFVVWGYVVMPEHFHFLISEPSTGTVAKAMQVLKQRVSLKCNKKKPLLRENPGSFWLPRYYDFNVFTERKHIEKLRYMHRNPVKRGLVDSPELWMWSSFRHYRFGETGLVKVGPETVPVFAGSK